MEEKHLPEWMYDDAVKDIPREKLMLLNTLFEQTGPQTAEAAGSKNKMQALKRMMPVIQKAKASRLNFSPGEVQAAITAIKNHSTAKELETIHKMEQTLQKNQER